MRKNILSFIVGTILLVSLNACGQKESIERITASATWDTYYENIQEIALSSDIICVVKVLNVADTYYKTDYNIPFTEFQVEVVKALKGADEGDAFRVLQTGISTDTMIFEIEDDPLLVIGDEYLIFGEYNNLGTVTILGGPQGRYIYEDEMISSLTSSDGYPILSLAEKVNTDSNSSFQKINANILFDEVEKCIAE